MQQETNKIHLVEIDILYHDRCGLDLKQTSYEAFKTKNGADDWIKKFISTPGNENLKESLGDMYLDGDNFVKYGDIRIIILNLNE